jgi:hypothetical protein
VHGERRERAHERGPVDEAQPLLGLELQGLEAELGQGLARSGDPVAQRDVDVLAGDQRGDVGEGDQVAARPAGAALGDPGEGVVVDQCQQPLDQLDPDAGVSLGEAVGAQEHGRAGDIGGGDRARPGSEVEDDASLQLRRARRRDLPVGAVPEAGRHPVDRDLPVDELTAERARPLHALRRIPGEDRGATSAGEPDDVGDPQ